MAPTAKICGVTLKQIHEFNTQLATYNDMPDGEREFVARSLALDIYIRTDRKDDMMELFNLVQKFDGLVNLFDDDLYEVLDSGKDVCPLEQYKKFMYKFDDMLEFYRSR